EEAGAAGAGVHADVDGVGAGDQGGARDVVREGRVVPAVGPARDAAGIRLTAGGGEGAGPAVRLARVDGDLGRGKGVRTLLNSEKVPPGRPRGYPLGLPQIRTCPMKASGSSGHRFAA